LAVCFGVRPGGAQPERGRPGGVRADRWGGRAWMRAGGLATARRWCAERVVCELLGRGGQRTGEPGGGEAANTQPRPRRGGRGGRGSGGQQRGEQGVPPIA